MYSSIRLSFLTDIGKIATVRVARPNLQATNLQVNEAMDDILESQAFDAKNLGEIVSKHSARLLMTNVINFNVA